MYIKNILYSILIVVFFFTLATLGQSSTKNYLPNEETESNTTFWTFSKWFFSAVAIGGVTGRIVMGNVADDQYKVYTEMRTAGSAATMRKDVEESVNWANRSVAIGIVSGGLALLSWIMDALSSDVVKKPIEFEKPKDDKIKPTSPPVLASTIQFIDTNGDNYLEAGETGKIILSLKNSGQGTAYYLRPVIGNINSNISIIEPEDISQLNPTESRNIIFTVAANENLQDGKTTFEIFVYEDNGFDLYPSAKLTVPTKKFREPNLIVTDIAIKDFNNNRKIELSEVVEVTARIQNLGEGDAKNAKADLHIGQNIFLAADSKTLFDLGNVNVGEYRDLVFSIYTNNRATDINVWLNLNAENQKLPSTQKLDLALDKVEKTASELVIKGIDLPKADIQISMLNIDIEQNIPETTIKNYDAVAVIIGNKSYTNPNVPFVDYAINDASLVREYLIKTLGYDDVNIIYEPNATQAKFISIFGSNTDYKGKLYNYLKEGQSDLFIYYSGHGAPDPQSKQGYFLPVDCDPSTVSLNGYSLNTFYQNLSKLPYKSLTVVIDACFSGSSEKGSLLQNISPIYISVENPVVAKENSTVFASASGEQVSSWYPEMKHSLFTYYFLKGLKGESDADNDKTITVLELKNFIDKIVPYMARRLNNREQTPQVIGDLNSIVVELK